MNTKIYTFIRLTSPITILFYPLLALHAYLIWLLSVNCDSILEFVFIGAVLLSALLFIYMAFLRIVLVNDAEIVCFTIKGRKRISLKEVKQVQCYMISIGMGGGFAPVEPPRSGRSWGVEPMYICVSRSTKREFQIKITSETIWVEYRADLFQHLLKHGVCTQ